MSAPFNPADTKLAPDFTVADYEKARDATPPNRDEIAEAIRRRFTKWYVEPVESEPTHGFTIMAVSCLMIEAFESFRQGWTRTDKKGRSTKAFCLFFDTSAPFTKLRGHGEEFHSHVRCGILHQAETTGGWRIRRNKTSPLFDAGAPAVNAHRFLEGLKTVVNEFCDGLKTAAWDSVEWKNVKHKMDAMVRHCAIPTKPKVPSTPP